MVVPRTATRAAMKPADSSTWGVTVAFTTALMQKDLTLALELAQALDVPLPATAAANEVLSLAQRLGYGDDDIARVADTLRGRPAHE